MLFIGASILILPFFIVVSIMKIGNYSNDGRKIGTFSIERYFHNKSKQDEEIPINWLKLIWRHSLPVAPLLHLLISFCFLFPRLITEAQLIRHGFLSKGNLAIVLPYNDQTNLFWFNLADIWKTDLDFILNKFNGKIFDFFGLLRTINITEHQNIFSGSATIGQYFIKNSKSLSETFYELDESGKFSIEFFNFAAALFVLMVRYPAVFWRVNKSFSAIFIFQLIVNFVQSIIAFSAFQVAFKIFVCDPTHLLIKFRESSSLNLVQLTVIFFFYILVLQFSSIALYIYGFQKYREFRYVRTKYFQLKYESHTLTKYLPFLVAMAFFLLFSVLIGPLFYEFIIIYCGSLNISALLIIVSSIIYFTIWIVIWVCLALKTEWTFEYDDFEWKESLIEAESMFCQSALLVVNEGKTYQIKEEAARQAILSFVQETLLGSAESDNKSNGHLDRTNYNRHSAKSFRSEKIRNKASNCRYSSMRYQKKSMNKSVNCKNESDSEGEYTTFSRVKRTGSFNHNSCLKRPYNPQTLIQMEPTGDNLMYKSNLIQTNPKQMSYDYDYMCNARSLNIQSNFQTNDKGSDTSSGIHSDGSNTSLGSTLEPKSLTKSNSLESLIQRLEAAKADKPNLRSLTSLQRSINLLNNLDSQPEANSCHVKLANFSAENEIYSTKIGPLYTDSKLVEFTENPNYSKYYSLMPSNN